MSAGRKVVAISALELRRTLRDRGSAFFILVFPLVLVLVLGSVFGGDSRLGLGVAAPTGDALADEVVAALADDEDVELSRYDSERSLRRAVERGLVEAGAVIPDGYGERLLSGEDAEVGFVAQPGRVGAQLQPVIAAAVGRQAVRVQAARFGASHGAGDLEPVLERVTELDAELAAVEVRTTTVGEELFPSGLGQFDVGGSSQLLLFVFVNGLAGSAVLIQSRQLGVARRMLSTPTSSRVVLLGELGGRLAVTLFQGGYIMAATWLLFGVDWGDPLGALAVLVVFAVVAAGAAMLLGAVFDNDQQASGVGVILGLGMAALGGSMAPLEVFSPLMRDIAHITPHAWGNDAFAELVRRDGGLLDILPELGVLAAMAAVLITLATRRLRRSLTATA